jgi:hypothetical protein
MKLLRIIIRKLKQQNLQILQNNFLTVYITPLYKLQISRRTN